MRPGSTTWRSCPAHCTHWLTTYCLSHGAPQGPHLHMLQVSPRPCDWLHEKLRGWGVLLWTQGLPKDCPVACEKEARSGQGMVVIRSLGSGHRKANLGAGVTETAPQHRGGVTATLVLQTFKMMASVEIRSNISSASGASGRLERVLNFPGVPRTHVLTFWLIVPCFQAPPWCSAHPVRSLLLTSPLASWLQPPSHNSALMPDPTNVSPWPELVFRAL